jgi:hypothetical protein
MRKVANSNEEFNNLLSDYKEQGWEIVDDNGERVLLELGLRGSWWWHVVLLFVFPIIANLIYMWYRRRGDRPKRGVIRLQKNS